MTIEVKTDGENLIFEDYLKRKITISQNDYLELMATPERQSIRPALEDCFTDPTEVWWKIENIEGEEYSYFKYFKVYSNLVFVAYVLMDDEMNFQLNNFFGYAENEFDEADKERHGQLIFSK